MSAKFATRSSDAVREASTSSPNSAINALVALGVECGVLLLEGVGDVLEEDKPEHDMLLLGGIHRTAQRVGHLSELGFVADVGGGL